MAMAYRRRRRTTSRWVLLGLLLSLVTVSVSVVSSAQTDGPGRRFSELAYLDAMRPLVSRSSAQGAELAQVRAEGLKLGRDGVRRQLGRVSQDAGATLGEVVRAEPPESLATAHSLLLATFTIRARAASTMNDGFTQAYTGVPLGPVVESLAGAAEDLVAADRTYQVFLHSLPSGDGSSPAMPASRWVPDARPWDRSELGVFLGALRSSGVPTPVHDLAVLLVTTKPPAVGIDGPAMVLPLVRSLQVEVVVANLGNSPERGVPVVATLTGVGGASESLRDAVDLDPGQRRSLVLNGLATVPAGPATLKVVIEPIPGEANPADNARSQPVVLRGEQATPPPSAPPSSTSTTRPRGGGAS